MKPLTKEIVEVAYFLFFGREPENEDVVRYSLSFGTLARLRNAFLNSLEFQMLLNRWPRLVPAGAPPLPLEWRCDDATVYAMLARLRDAWSDTPPGSPADAGAIRDPSGEGEAADLLACLRRAGIAPVPSWTAFAFGCGGGRVTRQLAASFAKVAGCDLSPLRLTAAKAAGPGMFTRVDDLRFGMTGAFDLWYSYLTLQCYQPPLLGRILERALALLRPGGVAVFQLPTYGYGYSFNSAAAPRPDPSLERHVLPQAVVFDIALAAGCTPAEAFDDLAVVPNPLWRSTMFVLRKRT